MLILQQQLSLNHRIANRTTRIHLGRPSACNFAGLVDQFCDWSTHLCLSDNRLWASFFFFFFFFLSAQMIFANAKERTRVMG
ncbi:hypothetical protein BJX76DRAFT_107184 [Aspergillus varians]